MNWKQRKGNIETDLRLQGTSSYMVSYCITEKMSVTIPWVTLATEYRDKVEARDINGTINAIMSQRIDCRADHWHCQGGKADKCGCKNYAGVG